MSEMYKEIRTAGKSYNEKNDCTVVAVSAATGHSYSEAHSAMADAGRKRHKGAKPHQTISALKALGFKTKNITISAIQKNYPPKYRPNTITPSQVRMLQNVWKDGKTYICFTASHALTIIDGEVIDWTDGRCHRITKICEVIGDRKAPVEKQMWLFEV